MPHISFKARVAMVRLRYGAYGKIGEPINSVRAISWRLCVGPDRVYYWLARYKADGCKLKVCYHKGHKRTRRKLTDEQEEILCSDEYLQKWAPLSLEQRCHLVHEMWGVSISPWLLSRTYRAHRITKTKAKYYTAHKWSKAELHVSRRFFTLAVLSLLQDEEEILYFDETTVMWD